MGVNFRTKPGYLKVALYTGPNYPETSKHHILPLSLFPHLEDDLDNQMEIPDKVHRSLHKNFSNYALIQDPIGCIIKCILVRNPPNFRTITFEDIMKKNNVSHYWTWKVCKKLGMGV